MDTRPNHRATDPESYARVKLAVLRAKAEGRIPKRPRGRDVVSNITGMTYLPNPPCVTPSTVGPIGWLLRALAFFFALGLIAYGLWCL